MTTTTRVQPAIDIEPAPSTRPRGSRAAAVLTLVLAAEVTLTCLVTLLSPGVLGGPAAMRGSAIGTALVVLTTAVPMLLASVLAARRGSALAELTWLGALAMTAYNGLLFLFATPFNRLFLLYVGWLGLTVWAAGTMLAGLDGPDLGRRFSARVPRRGVAAYIAVVVALNAALWLRGVVPALLDGGPAGFLRGTGLTTNIVYVQDLALWLPLMAVVSTWLWRGRAWGLVLGTAGLVMWCLESVSIAVDQAYGAAFDPASPAASATLTPVFIGLAIVGVVPILLLLKDFDGEGLVVKALRLVPPAARPSTSGRLLVGSALLVGASAVYGGSTLARDGWGMPDSWLVGTPFTGWTVPGIALVIGVALPQLATAVVVTGGWDVGRLLALASGVLLVAWIAIQLLVLHQAFILQPVIAGIGALQIWLAHRTPTEVT